MSTGQEMLLCVTIPVVLAPFFGVQSDCVTKALCLTFGWTNQATAMASTSHALSTVAVVCQGVLCCTRTIAAAGVPFAPPQCHRWQQQQQQNIF